MRQWGAEEGAPSGGSREGSVRGDLVKSSGMTGEMEGKGHIEGNGTFETDGRRKGEKWKAVQRPLELQTCCEMCIKLKLINPRLKLILDCLEQQ